VAPGHQDASADIEGDLSRAGEEEKEPSGLGHHKLQGVFTLPFSGGFANAVGRFHFEEESEE
jgi:hypothetical protein